MKWHYKDPFSMVFHFSDLFIMFYGHYLSRALRILSNSQMLNPFTLDRIKNRQIFCLHEVAIIRTCFVWFFRINYVLSVLFLDNYLNSKLSKLNEVKISDHIGSYLIHILRLHLHVDVSVCLSCVFFFFDAFACVLH